MMCTCMQIDDILTIRSVHSLQHITITGAVQLFGCLYCLCILYPGECNCTTFYHGAYCDIDERDPLVVSDIEGGGQCDISNGDECKCFTVRTANAVIDTFQCIVKAFTVNTYLALKETMFIIHACV